MYGMRMRYRYGQTQRRKHMYMGKAMGKDGTDTRPKRGEARGQCERDIETEREREDWKESIRTTPTCFYAYFLVCFVFWWNASPPDNVEKARCRIGFPPRSTSLEVIFNFFVLDLIFIELTMNPMLSTIIESFPG